jgi:hypothetical protein
MIKTKTDNYSDCDSEVKKYCTLGHEYIEEIIYKISELPFKDIQSVIKKSVYPFYLLLVCRYRKVSRVTPFRDIPRYRVYRGPLCGLYFESPYARRS